MAVTDHVMVRKNKLLQDKGKLGDFWVRESWYCKENSGKWSHWKEKPGSKLQHWWFNAIEGYEKLWSLISAVQRISRLSYFRSVFIQIVFCFESCFIQRQSSEPMIAWSKYMYFVWVRFYQNNSLTHKVYKEYFIWGRIRSVRAGTCKGLEEDICCQCHFKRLFKSAVPNL